MWQEVEGVLTADNLIEKMFETEDMWNKLSKGISQMIKEKEEEGNAGVPPLEEILLPVVPRGSMLSMREGVLVGKSPTRFPLLPYYLYYF